MNQREVAWRVFAEEYNSSLLEHTGEGEKPVSYVITPLGAKINRILIVGVVTDVEDIGDEGKPRYRARIADPTGTFYISASEFQPAAATALSKISPPAFAAVVGKSRVYSPEEGVKYLSIRPERIREVDADVRDMWTVETARSTIQRIGAMAEGLRMVQPNAAELVKLGYPEGLADGVVRAVEYYKEVDLDRFRRTVAEALRSVLPEERIRKPREAVRAPEREETRAEEAPMRGEEQIHEVSVGSDEEDTVLKIIAALESGTRGAPWEKIVEAAKAKRIDKVRLEEIVASLLDKGEVYEPELGMMKRI